MKTKLTLLAAMCGALTAFPAIAADKPTPVTIDTFIRAEADTYVSKKVEVTLK